jgi:hypothetical protein
MFFEHVDDVDGPVALSSKRCRVDDQPFPNRAAL